MKRFLLKLFLFLAAIFILAAALDVIVSKGVLKMEDYRFQDYAAMLKGGMDHDVLIMGNSRGKSHYDTYLIDSLCHVSSFCIGVGGYPFNVQLMKYHLYREHNAKPRVIIQELDHGTIQFFADVRHQHQSEQFFPLVYDRAMRKELKGMGYGWCELNLPMYRYYGYQQVIKNGLLEFFHLKHYVTMPAYKGHRPEEGPWNGAPLAEMEEQKITITDENLALFESYLQQCRSDSIQVVLVYSPIYIEATKKMIGFDNMRDLFRSLASKYEFHYLDYTTGCPISQDTSNFCISVHMNPEATLAFAYMLCDDLHSLDLFRKTSN
jgi:hypothetical protein